MVGLVVQFVKQENGQESGQYAARVHRNFESEIIQIATQRLRLVAQKVTDLRIGRLHQQTETAVHPKFLIQCRQASKPAQQGNDTEISRGVQQKIPDNANRLAPVTVNDAVFQIPAVINGNASSQENSNGEINFPIKILANVRAEIL